jgi:hypothetical protein
LPFAGCGSVPLAAQVAAAARTSPQDPRSISLTAGSLPDGLAQCPVSGAIDSYLHHLQADGSPSYEITAGQWAAMKRLGATAGWVESYARDEQDCAVRLGERLGPSAISFAIRFRDATAALDGFGSGFQGLRPARMEVPGLTQGVRTQLTADAWTYDQTDRTPSVFVAFWANRQFDLFLLTERLPAAAAQRAAADMNGRVN